MARSVSVVGGGVIGLSIAWRAARNGWSVRLYDPSIGSGASWVAGGMLAPLSEGWPGEESVLELGSASLDRWPEFGKELEAGAGVELFTSESSLTVALDGADAEDLRTIAEWVGAQGRDLQILNRAEVRALEPMLGRGVRLGLLAVDELAVDNRLLLQALRHCAEAAGVELIGEAVRSLDQLEHGPDRRHRGHRVAGPVAGASGAAREGRDPAVACPARGDTRAGTHHPRQRPRPARLPGAARRRHRRRSPPSTNRATTHRSPWPACAT